MGNECEKTQGNFIEEYPFYTLKTLKMKKKSGFLSLLAIALMSTSLWAQPCKTESVIINTGYDPVAQTRLAIGATDPEWRITSYSPDLLNPANTTLGFVPVPGPAVAADGVGGVNDVNSQWLSFYDPPGAAWTSWYKTLVPGDYHFMIQRNFTIVCGQTDLTVDMKIARDNYVLGIRILDAGNNVIWNTLLDPAITVNIPSYYNSFHQIPVFTLSGLVPGTYHIELDVHNLHLDTNPLSQNPHGVNIVGLLTASSGNLLAPGNTDCDCDCSDKCYWKVEGNNIQNGNNIFGTLTDDDIRIKTANNDRGIIKSGNSYTGGFLGWNTMSPTARLHVNCAEGNKEGGLSDIRFEDLESGSGNILVIDEAGYVYNSRVDLRKLIENAVQKGQSRVDELEQEVRQLREEITAMMKGRNTGSITPEAGTSLLYQNIPNPFGAETIIPYYIKSMQQSAMLIIYDSNGREMSRHAITEAGKGRITLHSKEMLPGNYLYTLIVDGQKIDTKTMTLTK